MTTVIVRTESGETIETILIGKEHIEDEHANDYIHTLIDLSIRNGVKIDEKERRTRVEAAARATVDKQLRAILRNIESKREEEPNHD